MNPDPIRVLIIEDDPEMAQYLRSQIEGWKGRAFAVAHELTLADGLRRLAAEGADVVLLDLVLPDSSGEETFLRVRERSPGTPIVVLTCVEDEALSDRLVGAGAQDYLLKGEVRGSVVVRTLRHVVDRWKAAQERERLLRELQEALAEVKTLSGLLPICSNCKKVRDDKGYWTNVETYIQQRSDAQFSHGICPGCMQILYPGYRKQPGT
jgi:DNA-binding NarL/FixJ family response regulator